MTDTDVDLEKITALVERVLNVQQRRVTVPHLNESTQAITDLVKAFKALRANINENVLESSGPGCVHYAPEQGDILLDTGWREDDRVDSHFRCRALARQVQTLLAEYRRQHPCLPSSFPPTADPTGRSCVSPGEATLDE